MPNFALINIDTINGKQVFEKLVVDDVCPFDEFERSIESNKKYYNELGSIYNYMEQLANGASLPETKFKDITPRKETVKEYEFKSRNLRVYAIKKENGKIIIFAGKKNNQKKDLKRFRSLKSQFLNQEKQP